MTGQREQGGASAAASKQPHILLLQGPIGPMFRDLQDRLEAEGARVTRVHFNAGDALFGPRSRATRFSGDAQDWCDWLDRCVADDRPDAIVMFGRKRPAHRLAAERAAAADIPVVSLEEGYLRSGFITAEIGGNNDLSPIAGKIPDALVEDIEGHPEIGPNFKAMNWLGFLYFTTSLALSKDRDAFSFHRPLNAVVPEGAKWVRNILRLWSKKRTEQRRIDRLIERHDGDYILVPLQMPADSQLGSAARGWTLERLVEEATARFARQDRIARLVFKLHPLDNDGLRRAKAIRAVAKRHGIADRVDVFHSGSIAEMSTHSDGMITINSTSGMSAIHHGTPLLVLGDAIFRHPDLVHVAEDADAIDDFYAERRVAPLDVRRNYERFVARHALIPGDYYLPSGRRIAAEQLCRRIYDLAGLNGSGSTGEKAA